MIGSAATAVVAAAASVSAVVAATAVVASVAVEALAVATAANHLFQLFPPSPSPAPAPSTCPPIAVESIFFPTFFGVLFSSKSAISEGRWNGIKALFCVLFNNFNFFKE